MTRNIGLGSGTAPGHLLVALIITKHFIMYGTSHPECVPRSWIAVRSEQQDRSEEANIRERIHVSTNNHALIRELILKCELMMSYGMD